MSFSSEVKAELCKIPVSRACCALAEAYGVLLYSNTFTVREIRIITASRAFAERLPRLFMKAFSLAFDSVSLSRKYTLLITDRDKIARIFDCYGYDAGSTIAHHVNLSVLEDECCQPAFVRGAYLAGGSITDPSKRYHLELVTDHYNVSREIFSILLEMGFTPKETSRSGNYVTYFKQSESIEDLFTTLGAPLSAMGIMQAKIEKGMRNTINRKVNCDSANADKVVAAAQEQIEAIKKLDKAVGLDKLPEKLHETAILRLVNPEASLADLSQLADPPVTKSCLSHRLKKLAELAEKHAD